jgi:hypothetical protein
MTLLTVLPRLRTNNLKGLGATLTFDAPERQVHIRVGGLDGRLYLDLGDEKWRAVEIDATGWRVIENPPVRFAALLA